DRCAPRPAPVRMGAHHAGRLGGRHRARRGRARAERASAPRRGLLRGARCGLDEESARAGREGPAPAQTNVGSGGAGELVVRVELRAQLHLETCHRVALELPHPLAGQAELLADRVERPRLALEAEAQLHDARLALAELLEGRPDGLAAERLARLLGRIDGRRAGEEVAELAVAVGPDRAVQRDGRVRRVERLLDVLQRELGCVRELLARRLAPELDLELGAGPAELLAPLVDVHGNADRLRLVRGRALAGLADAPGRVGRELVAL